MSVIPNTRQHGVRQRNPLARVQKLAYMPPCKELTACPATPGPSVAACLAGAWVPFSRMAPQP